MKQRTRKRDIENRQQAAKERQFFLYINDKYLQKKAHHALELLINHHVLMECY